MSRAAALPLLLLAAACARSGDGDGAKRAPRIPSFSQRVKQPETGDQCQCLENDGRIEE